MARGKTRSGLRLQARLAKAEELYTKGYDPHSVARELGVTYSTALRYKSRYEQSVKDTARSNPGMLREVIQNTVRALEELDLVREEAWRKFEATSNDAVKASMLKIILSAQEQRAKLYGLFGVKADYFAHVQQVRDQQDRLVEFMQKELCPADRIKLEEYLIREFNEELATLPSTATEVEL